MYIINDKLISWLVFSFSFFLSSQLGKHFFFPFSYLSGIRIDYLAPTIYLTDILSVPFMVISLILLARQWRTIRSLIQKNLPLCLTFFLLIDINYFFSLSKEMWFYSLWKILQWALVLYFFWYHRNKKSVYSAVLYGLLLGSFFQCMLAIRQLMLRHSLQGIWYWLGERSFAITTPGIAKAYLFGKEFLRPYGTFSHPNSMGGFYLFIYVFILTQKKLTNQILKFALLTLSSFLVFLSFSRSVLVLYGVLNLFYFSRNMLQCKVCLLAKLAVASVLLLIVFNITGDANSLNKRADFSQKSIRIIQQRPLSGTGIGSYLIAQHAYPQKYSFFFEQPVHNIFLLATSQLGIPLTILLLALIVPMIKKQLVHLSFLLPLCVLVGTGAIDHYWLTLQQNVLVSAVIFGILFLYEKKTART